MRVYAREIIDNGPDPEWIDEVYTVKDFMFGVRLGYLDNEGGSGYWAKDGKRSKDEVFSSEQLDATHVVWFSK